MNNPGLGGIVTQGKSQREVKDFYPTPKYVIEALLDNETFEGMIWEPTVGKGNIVDTLKDYGYKNLFASDIKDYGYTGTQIIDFLNPMAKNYPHAPANIITNPPYSLSKIFMEHGVGVVTGKIALLLPIRYLAGKNRYKFYKINPPKKVIIIPNKIDFLGKGNPVMEFAWYIWQKEYIGKPTITWADVDRDKNQSELFLKK